MLLIIEAGEFKGFSVIFLKLFLENVGIVVEVAVELVDVV